MLHALLASKTRTYARWQRRRRRVDSIELHLIWFTRRKRCFWVEIIALLHRWRDCGWQRGTHQDAGWLDDCWCCVCRCGVSLLAAAAATYTVVVDFRYIISISSWFIIHYRARAKNRPILFCLDFTYKISWCVALSVASGEHIETEIRKIIK